MPTRRDRRPVGWLRRPRPPLHGALATDVGLYSGKFAAFVGLGLPAMIGLGTAIEGGAWWLRALGALIGSAAGAGIVALAVYLRRPESETFVKDAAASWRADLARTGRVELGVSRFRATWMSVTMLLWIAAACAMVAFGSLVGVLFGVLSCLVLVPLGLLPHLEFLTGRGPAVQVDAQGIRIARWWPLLVPWAEVRGVHVENRTVAVISTTAEFAGRYESSRPPLLRGVGFGPAWFTTDGIVISTMVAAHPDALAWWLAQEAAERGGSSGHLPRRRQRRRSKRRVHRVP